MVTVELIKNGYGLEWGKKSRRVRAGKVEDEVTSFVV